MCFSGLCPPAERRLASRPLATAWSVRRFVGHCWRVIDPRLSLCRLTSSSLSHATFLRVVMTFFFFLFIVTCFAMSFALRSDATARHIPDASLLHCTRERPHAFELCEISSLCWMRIRILFPWRYVSSAG